ncbi:ATP-dependent zinc metalloprotease FtsH [Pseudomonas panipatensis]|uniref:ATP-dependent zinc metalloprotease FtsH n=1 Tax=Pseudomonas panipatensis TaxID=428992 RepID=A0A1G8LBZ8_9PSED|nr:ATP-dependent zinc metalloprotease FtsH [Pseudomonas panipatensis]SDI53222.1 cell division protease FtsH [Pseudomonas panipatensis]SMP75249.1 membrane protease FtsH catalytic subunit [Pseudomonas panipatensis]
MEKHHEWNLWYFIAAFSILLILQNWLGNYSAEAPIPYSEFQRLLAAGKLSDLKVDQERISGTLKEPIQGRTRFTTNRVEPGLAAELEKSNVEFNGVGENTAGKWLGWLLPFILIFALWTFFFRGMAEKQGFGGMVNVGKSKAKVFVERDTGVTFDDVAGIDEAKAELQEVVSFLKDRPTYSRLGARIPKGILLVGPPGTGKTLVAKAVAGEAGVPFFSISGSEFVELFVGVGAARVRDLFEQARKAAPCIIFIDELDALGKMRGLGAFGGNDEKEQTLNQLLAELDGFDPREGVVLLAATNRPEVLDPALLRAGRFDRQILIDRPDRRGRAAILRVHLKRITAGPDVDSEQIAAITTGFTGADLANLVNEAAIGATRRGGEAVSMADFNAAVERIVAGAERKSRLLQPAERKVVAYHEMGHALAAATLPRMDPVHKVSIIPHSIGALGFTLQRPTEDRFLIGRQELKDRMVVLLAGRAAESLVFGEISTGAADDLAKVTDIARQLVTRFGMSESLGQAVLERQSTPYLGDNGHIGGMREKDYSEETAREVDLCVRELIHEAYERARALLESRRDDLDEGARLLLEKETLSPEEFPPLAAASAPARD